jgi:bacterioferritin-associated ferredoxin
MIVCLCTGTTHRQLKRAIDEGAENLEALSRACRGAGGECGTCRPQIQRLLDSDGQPESAGLGNPTLLCTLGA